MTRNFSFSAYLTGMALIIALPLVGLLAYDIHDHSRKSQEDAESISLQFSRLTAEQAGNALRQGEKILMGLAQIPEIRALDPRKCSSLLRELNDLLEQYPNVVTRDATGTLVCSALTLPGGARPRAVSDYYLKEVLRTGGFVVGKPVRGNFTGKWALALAYPLRDGQNRITGVVVLPMDLVKFHPAAGATSLPDGMVIQIINADGVVIASTRDPGAWVGRNIRHTELAMKAVTARQGGMHAPDAEGIPRIYGLAAVPGTDWRVFAGVPAETVFEKSWHELRRLVMIFILTMAMAALLAFLLARTALGSIRNIAATAAAVAAGDKTARARPSGPTEVRSVAARFNAMLDALDLAEQRISGIIRSAMDGVITVNERHEITLVNPAAERMFGYSAADLLGKPVNILIPDGYHTAYDEHIRNFRRANVAHRMTVRFGGIVGRRADGTEFSIDASISQMEQAGQRQFTAIMHDITRRIEAENALRESELRLRLAARAGNIGFWDRDIASGRVYFSSEWKSQLGYRDDEISDDPEEWESRLHPEDRDRVLSRRNAYVENRPSDYQTEYRMRHKDGSYRWFYVRGELLNDAAGAPQRVVGCRTDITAFKLVQQELESRIALAQLLESLARVAGEAKGPAEAMRVCLERLCEFGKWTLGRMASYRSGGSLHLPDSVIWYPADPAGFDEFIRVSNNLDHVKPEGRFISVVLRERKPVWLADLSAACDFGRRSIALAHGLRAAFAFPLVIQDEVAGFFEFYAATPRLSDPLLMEASELIAAQLAVVIEHSRAREIQAQLAAIVESSNDAIVSRDRDGITVSWNAAAERMFGWTAQEAIGRPTRLIVPPERIGALQPLVQRAMHGEYLHPVESTFLCRDGTRIQAYVTLSGIRDERGDVFALALTINDITDLKRKEKALQEYSMRLRRLSVRLLEVEDAERRSISRELHDRIGQDLSALNLTFGMLRSQLPEESQTAVQTRLKDMQGLLRAIVVNVRDVMSELRPPVLDDYGLLAALRHLLEKFAERTTISADVKGNELNPRLPSVVETAMFRISQEALNNIAKHAQAKKVEVSLGEDSRHVVLEIADDGVGFNLEGMLASEATWGIATMRERAEAVGIGFRMESAPGSGTRVVIEVARSAA